MRFEAVIFDFDYTLADSSKGIVECVDFALSSLGLPPAPAEEICTTIGLPLQRAFQRLAGPQHHARLDEFLRLFIERADAVMVDRAVILKPVPETLAALRLHGVRMGIVSTKFRRRIEAILEREKLRDSFGIIVGGEDVAVPKPDPEGLLTAVGGVGSSASRCLYVGDSVIDAETAKRAGVPFAAVLSGVTSSEQFVQYDAYRVLESLSELPALLAR